MVAQSCALEPASLAWTMPRRLTAYTPRIRFRQLSLMWNLWQVFCHYYISNAQQAGQRFCMVTYRLDRFRVHSMASSIGDFLPARTPGNQGCSSKQPFILQEASSSMSCVHNNTGCLRVLLRCRTFSIAGSCVKAHAGRPTTPFWMWRS
jgi:hypothetical protein